MSLGVGAIVGAGIFVLTGEVAAQYAGPAVILSFIFAGIACGLAGLCYAEMASTIPVAGSAYTYAYAALGELLAWVIGWDLVLEYTLGSATVAVGWSGYIVSFMKGVGLPIPSHIAGFNYPAALIVLFVTALLAVGVQESSRANNVIVAIKLAVLFLFVVAGGAFLFSHPGVLSTNWVHFIPPNTGKFGQYGWSGVLRGAGVIFFAYIGFDAVSTTAQEARNPQRDMPIGILGSLAICTVLYILVSFVLTALVPYQKLLVPDPMAVGIDAIGSHWLSPLVKLGAIAGLSSVILVLLLAQPRILWAMAQDGLLPPVFARIHPRFKTPLVATVVTGAFVALLAGLVPIAVLGELVSIGTLFAFLLVCAGVLVLRRTEPHLVRPFRVPGVPWVPLLGILVCLVQMLGLPWETWVRLVLWMAAGMAIYVFYGRQHSALSTPEKNGATPVPATQE